MSSSTHPDREELYAVADFCLIPMGTGEPSVGPYIAQCQRILEKSGLTYKMHKLPHIYKYYLRPSQRFLADISGYGTNIEGPWHAVTAAIHDCHAAVHAQGAPRIATDIRIGTRTDKSVAPGQGNALKVQRVEEILQKWDNEVKSEVLSSLR